MQSKKLLLCVFLNAVIITTVAVYMFLYPAVLLVVYLNDDGLVKAQTPRFVYQLHQQLSNKMGPWAKERVLAKAATQLGVEDVAGTEWPIFSSVFYLWATENLQHAWEIDHTLSKEAPNKYGADAIKAAIELILDENHATWVKQHWGETYLEKENLFYRMLIISGMTSYQSLTGDNQFEPFLRRQVNSLAKELDDSPYGLLDDYPEECYPVDIVPAIVAIARADRLLNTDHSAMIQRAIRGFSDTRLDSKTNLPAYNVSARTGEAIGGARGVGVSFMTLWSPEIWPATANQWYTDYVLHFWQHSTLFAGFREFPKHVTNKDWFLDIDSGPVLNGYGVAASAFGIGAARANDHFEHAYALSAMGLACSWPLPDGTLLTCRLLSNASDAPYVGEAALLFGLSVLPVNTIADMNTHKEIETRTPLLVYIIIFSHLLVAVVLLWSVVKLVRQWCSKNDSLNIKYPKAQFVVYLLLMSVAMIGLAVNATFGYIFMMLMLLFPRIHVIKPEKINTLSRHFPRMEQLEK